VSLTDLADALNDLPTLYPDGVKVVLVNDSDTVIFENGDTSSFENGLEFIVEFSSDRG
jgi:hypothetical protein